ncbi:hypothetical protein L1987_01671 [Smallanthus sonchifolius]|uniref:Uncharacterized protein n=1 Tax=Smallanthus sonchifolius TaxID=185202 RepID=A0ACB9K5S1_9ASTR|nr:hypothetical protein L1987_01671 [Smallanthus sonchifolius]
MDHGIESVFRSQIIEGNSWKMVVPFGKTVLRTTGKDRSRHRRLSIQENGRVGDEDVCADIIGAEWKMTKKREGPCSKLVVWVPKTGFTEFVNVNQQFKLEGRFSIAIFCYTLHKLPFSIQPIFKPFVNDKGESNGTYDQLLVQIEGKTCEAVAGDVIVRASRTKYVDCTIPYLSSEVYMLVRATHE